MKRTAKITLCAMMVALASVLMLTSYFPYLTISIPAIAGLFIMVLVIETDYKYSILAYLASAIIVFLVAEPEAKMLYVLFFGYYPIIKSILEKIKSRAFEYVAKFLVFNLAVVSAYLLLSALFSFKLTEFGNFGKYSIIVLLLVANFVFAIYDVAVSRMAQYYIYKIHPSVIKVLKGK